MSPPVPQGDLDEILTATASLWPEMRGRQTFLTGGTGFFGCWLVESFLHINRTLTLDAQLTVLTRNPGAFLTKMPHLRDEAALRLIEGDVREFRFPSGAFDFIIHAATEASAKQLAERPEEMTSTILDGTQRVLALAAASGTRKLLFTSSGAIYGPQSAEISHISEDLATAPATAYGEAKLAAEALCAHAASPALEIKIARCFAFVGPHLPLDTHFAAGNFLADALAGRPIRIVSDGSSERSYLYAADLATWLWSLLFAAPSRRPYNVGSEEAVSIRELAEAVVRAVNPAVAIEIAQPIDPTRPPQRYIPSTARARAELGLRQTVSLEEGLRRTSLWHQLKSKQEP
jgi:dTDP-glucose 4,6-dehydratase